MNNDEQREQLLRHLLLHGEPLAAFPEEAPEPPCSDISRMTLHEVIGTMGGSGETITAMARRFAELLQVPWLAAADLPPLETSDLQQAFDESRSIGMRGEWATNALRMWLRRCTPDAAMHFLLEGVPSNFQEEWNVYHLLEGDTTRLIPPPSGIWTDVEGLLPILTMTDPGPSRWLEQHGAPAHVIVAHALNGEGGEVLSDDQWAQVIKRLWLEPTALKLLEEALGAPGARRPQPLVAWVERGRASIRHDGPENGEYLAP